MLISVLLLIRLLKQIEKRSSKIKFILNKTIFLSFQIKQENISSVRYSIGEETSVKREDLLVKKIVRLVLDIIRLSVISQFFFHQEFIC